MSDIPLPDDLSTDTDAPDGSSPLEAMTRERDDLYDRLLRKGAEFDNFRKRVERERREQADWAAASLIGDVLDVVDDFERALAVDAPAEAHAYRSGVELIHRQLLDLLKKRGVTVLDTQGQDFDPNVHQAVAYDEVPGSRDGQVIGELRRGYRLGEKLLRPALVRVAKAS